MFTRTNLRLALATATAVSLTGGLLTLSVGTATAATPAKYADDFNGDGYRDFVVGGLGDGAVVVTYGAATGPGTTTKTFTQATAGIPGTRGEAGGYGDAFGEDMATADLNRDGYADLAVADFTEKVGGKAGSGAVTILWGRKTGLTGSDATRLKVTARSDQGFGKGIETGDFNGDGKADLAVSNGWDSVYVYRGGFAKSGTTGTVTKHTLDATFEVTGLVAGKVTKDKSTDLFVLGQGYHSDKMTQDVWFLRGGSTIKPGKVTVVNSSTPDYSPTGVVADFDKDGYGDLAVSDTRHNNKAGSVVVWRGGGTGPTTKYRITQASSGVATGATTRDYFGSALSAGDTNGDGYPDLAVGVPSEKVGSMEDAGGVHVLRGAKSGLTGTNSRWFTRATAGVPGDASEYDNFGTLVRLRDIDRDGDKDLLVSSNYYDPSVLLPGTAAGITATGAKDLNVVAAFPQ
ncbi:MULTISPECIES: FG-GAP and VCBS repeat-containing protein [unclassified Streptomyces]|uniref:FG-GAP and VCBS repeat-containing protein n=1 Tax=unclassified Streptomyces TaxID=2593676 RepID=UPI002252C1A4|nr:MULTISPECIES: FG-GAP and VCBS repeat-containing protein [unclassified Streptomyces]MCX5332267.1 FG-GAP and VCBS repeat-containing protein [Streptomyces sp. NBC_00140]MCX5361644.1 FG-GAP and VCBS repeat-containing protein [Streptomyces sp. NBC_00124]